MSEREIQTEAEASALFISNNVDRGDPIDVPLTRDVCFKNYSREGTKRWREVTKEFGNNKDHFPEWTTEIFDLILNRLASEGIERYLISLADDGKQSKGYKEGTWYLATQDEIKTKTKAIFHGCRKIQNQKKLLSSAPFISTPNDVGETFVNTLPKRQEDDDGDSLFQLSFVLDQIDANPFQTFLAKSKELEQRLQTYEKGAKGRATSLIWGLTEEELTIVTKAINGEGADEEVVAQIDNKSVQRHLMRCLQPGEWLNDEVIDYFFVLLAKRDEELCHQDSQRKPCHFFKSLFMTMLFNPENKVERWSENVKGKDIFELSKIFFPIKKNQMHWLCAVAFMDEKRIQIYDSLGSTGMYFLENIFRYIQDEHLEKKKTTLPDVDQWKLVPCAEDTPSQHNGERFVLTWIACYIFVFHLYLFLFMYCSFIRL